MGKVEDINKALAQSPKAKTVQDYINESIKELGKALPKHMNAERLGRIALTCIRLNPELARCTPESFLGALFTSAQIGLEPVAGLAYLLPFNNNRKIGNEWKTVKEVQLVIGYKGLTDLFFRHEKSVQLDWGVVHANDDFRYEYGTSSFLKHVPASGDRGEVTNFYVVATLAGGGKPFLVMTKAECLEHGKKHSKTFDHKTGAFNAKSPWSTNLEAMCKKTVAIQLFKILPLSVELQRAIGVDETSREFRKGITDALDIPTTDTWEDPETAASAPVDAKQIKQEIDPVTGEVVPEVLSNPKSETLL
jgi:recombination protein RecT